ncbi:MAG: cytochrome C biogenesis protein [Deltaproteobacteria bacterium CG11_big_fil_rev_8_21_14_0_20_45_16]|nr:MAG: cytochrome C biogenesis protein [Deltaproteobacteria bacterium CG11_big_fil_rev_8_21_14_0_20_45_16]
MTTQAFWPGIGEICISLSLMCAIYAFFTSLIGARRNSDRMVNSANRAIFGCCVLISLAVFVLWFCLLKDNFLVRYVYSYSNREMPTIYKLTALWGGQDGSLLFWVWLLSLYSSAALFFHRNSDRPLIPHMISVLSFIIIFFNALIIYSDNPFELFPFAQDNGRGLNPLLQNPSMAIHPPCLYLGFVGMAIPFAFAMSALIGNRLSVRWIAASRIWSLIAWFFLSIGNLLGAQWAYVELGWGGFWGWDPVENAAILPWFTASAFLHSVMIQEKRGMLKFWNMNLISLSFCLTILGTYLTRSGVVQSVHSFASSSIGYWFLVFLGLVILFSGFFIWKRRKELKSDSIFESFLSKESAFVVNNIALVGSAFIILWSTLFPSASELITGTRIIVGPPFFNKILAPFALVLLILTGIGPVIAWRKASPRNLKTNFTLPIIAGLLTLLVLALLKIYSWYVLITGFGAGFVICTIIMEFYRGTRARMIAHHEGALTALFRSSLRNHRKYGGYIVHLGIVFIFVGIAGSVYKEVHEFTMKKGDRVSFGSYSVVMKGFDTRDNVNQREDYALLDLYIGDKFVKQMKPARFFYKQQQQPSTEVDIYPRLKEDVYFILGFYAPFIQQATIRIILQPFIIWLWLGGLTLVIGGLISMLPSFGLKLESSRIKSA